MARRLRLFPWMLLLSVLSLAVLVWSGVELYKAHIYNRTLAADEMQAGKSAKELFANAWRLANKGQTDKALELYVEAAAKGDDALRKAAYFNSGNLYLSQSVEILEGEGYVAWDKVGPLMSLCKENYSKALLIDPEWIDAKYNLELALRLSPSFAGVKTPNRYNEDDDDIDEAEKRPDGWPSIPGFPRGMP
ncbi:hypothetical protein LG201_00435 [Methylobacillus gramineus]|uniref:hypothetical protein n=1 Tax=Methylobacillus gramineus TaxID=755169 RepID=UPI001D0012E9|nr:hypothetical protein [Methylobacillus gramineus]MCB5183672.1 hypothetical protein [Methylobacillus gramineus]